MNVPTILEVVALVLGVIELIRSRGQSLIAWAVVALAVALLWHVVS